MTSSPRAWLIPLLIVSACDSTDPAPPGGAADLAGAIVGDLATSHDGGTSMCSATSPSGYACDPWGTHLYVTDTAKRQGSTLRLKLQHNPDFEGYPEDMTIPPEHDYYQQLTVDIALTDPVRRFLCIVFNAAATPTSFDASSPTFFNNVDPGYHGLVPDTFPDPPPVTDLIDICGGPTLPAVRWPSLVNPGGTNKPILPAVALAVPLTPAPRQFQVGTTFGAWLARGVLSVDEESELSPQLTATVVDVQ
jgi:hypothetical protein